MVANRRQVSQRGVSRQGDDHLHQVVFKLKAGPRAKARVSALAATLRGGQGPRRRSARVASASAESPLHKALTQGKVSFLEPLFSTPTLRRRGSARAMALSVEHEEEGELQGLNLVQFESRGEARDARELIDKDRVVEYAHHPEERFLALPTRKKSKRRGRSRQARVDPMRSRQWGLVAVELAQAQRTRGFADAAQVTIAVIDSGVDSDHPDLLGIFIEEKNFTHGPLKDTAGHGTHVSGILGAITNNGTGISGLCQSKRLISIKALNPYNARGYYEAVRFAGDCDAQIINMSLAGGHDPTEEILLKRAMDRGAIVVAAMGNDGSTRPSYPAATQGVIAIGATNETDDLASFSNRGRHIHLVAPGENILSTVPTYPAQMAERENYDAWPGTSMAAPFVAATVALMLAKNSELTSRQVGDALKKGADKVAGLKRFSTRFGHGRLNVRRTLELV